MVSRGLSRLSFKLPPGHRVLSLLGAMWRKCRCLVGSLGGKSGFDGIHRDERHGGCRPGDRCASDIPPEHQPAKGNVRRSPHQPVHGSKTGEVIARILGDSMKVSSAHCGLMMTSHGPFRGRRVDRDDAARIELLASKPLLEVLACGLRLGIQGSRFVDSDARRHGVPRIDVRPPPLAGG